MRTRLILASISAVIGMTWPALGQFARPKPEVFARVEDQQRARLLTTRCVDADEGRGCYRYENRLIREYPCTKFIEPNTLDSLPTDQCYKMDMPHTYRGVWINEFEGQQFIPEGTVAADWPRADRKSPGWSKRFEQFRLGNIWLDTSRVTFEENRPRYGGNWFIEFSGRKTLYPGAYGHMGMSGQEIVVDRLIALRKCPETGVCR